ncbi:hypothetical protein HYV73_00215 [Candidatus Uhrbacteria bacterium]|nr:hypothetical protein [Candidatus Uhrbacteria bacterium]
MEEKTFKGIARPLTSLFFALLLAASCLLPAFSVSAATASIELAPASGAFMVGQTFTVHVFVQTDTPVNAVEGAIVFPSELVEATGITTEGTIISHWFREPFIDRGQGTIQFTGVDLTPGGFVGSDGLVFTAEFKTLKEGRADIRFQNASVLSGDGEGTNIVRQVRNATFTIAAPPPTSPPSFSPAEPDPAPPDTPPPPTSPLLPPPILAPSCLPLVPTATLPLPQCPSVTVLHPRPKSVWLFNWLFLLLAALFFFFWRRAAYRLYKSERACSCPQGKKIQYPELKSSRRSRRPPAP